MAIPHPSDWASSSLLSRFVGWIATTADGQQASVHRDDNDWEYLSFSHIPFTPLDNLGMFGWQQLEENRAARAATAREIDATVDEATVIDRIKSDHPESFEEALPGEAFIHTHFGFGYRFQREPSQVFHKQATRQ